VWQAQKERIDVGRLEQRVAQAGWLKAWQSLVQFIQRWESGEPLAEEVERWANEGP
jgi:hypothetical protein